MSPRTEVEALLRLIRDSALKALDQYESYGSPVPPLQSTQSHPLDLTENKLGLKKIIGTLEGACEQLCSTLASPTQTVLNRVQDYHWICMRVAVKLKIADKLALHPKGLHINDLAIAVSAEPRKLASVLRVLATKHCFQEIGPDIFANNRLSLTLASTHSISAVVMFSTDRYEFIHSLPEYLRDSEYGFSTKATDAPFQYFMKDQHPSVKNMTFYQWLELPINKERREVNLIVNQLLQCLMYYLMVLKTMAKAMIGISDSLGGLPAVDAYDWSLVKTVCDVGAGIGHFSRALLNATSDIHVTLFDLPRTIENTRQQWNGDYLARVQFVAGDILQEIPVMGCDIYYLRNFIHNWSDENAVTIMMSIRRAMGSKSRLLIHDPVIRPLCRASCSSIDEGEVTFERAPEPLLPNYGAGYIQVQNMNMTMLSLFNSHERSLSELTSLGHAANLCLIHVYDLGDTCIMEFALSEL